MDGDGPALHVGGCCYESPEDAFHTGVLGFCGCGNPEQIVALFQAFLALLRSQWAETRADDPTRLDLTPERQAMYRRHREERDALFANDTLGLVVAYEADRVGLTEHGGAIGGEWLTDAGELWLDLLSVSVQEES
jgi:hypothetical protein